jgi:hypothetical protein
LRGRKGRGRRRIRTNEYENRRAHVNQNVSEYNKEKGEKGRVWLEARENARKADTQARKIREKVSVRKHSARNGKKKRRQQSKQTEARTRGGSKTGKDVLKKRLHDRRSQCEWLKARREKLKLTESERKREKREEKRKKEKGKGKRERTNNANNQEDVQGRRLPSVRQLRLREEESD